MLLGEPDSEARNSSDLGSIPGRKPFGNVHFTKQLGKEVMKIVRRRGLKAVERWSISHRRQQVPSAWLFTVELLEGLLYSASEFSE